MVRSKEELRDLEIFRSLNMMQTEQYRSTVLWAGYVVGETRKMILKICYEFMCVKQKIHQINHVFEVKARFLP
jgi:3-deoxy-D-manno-octulosonic acid (KDO) 8-phosphate synthase